MAIWLQFPDSLEHVILAYLKKGGKSLNAGKKMLKPFLCFSLPRILRDRSFARTSDLDWGNYTLITYLLDYLCVFFYLPHNDICRSICFKLCLKPAICFEPHRSNAKYQRCVLLCINIYLCFSSYSASQTSFKEFT